jgi:RNA polymerase sigma-70 factor (ECF subfamily)
MSRLRAELIAMLPRLHRFARSLCRSSTAAEDLVQATCVKALANAEAWTPGTRFDAWVYQIMRNHWIDTLRKTKSEGAVEPLETSPQIAGSGEQQVLAHVELGFVQRAIDELPVEQREVLLLVCVDDLSYADAAAITGVPVGTVMSRLARARRQLLVQRDDTDRREARP